MKIGIFYAVGVGPGEPELLTLKAVRLLSESRYLYVPFSRMTTQTWVCDAVQQYARQDAVVSDVSFSLGQDSDERKRHWSATAAQIIEQLKNGEDVVFVTLGDPLLYSTAIYLIRALREQWQDVSIDVVPGVSAYSHCAALTGFSLGEGTKPVTIIPTITAMADLQSAIERGGTLALMKIGRHLQDIIDLLDDNNLLDQAVFVARAGLPDQRVEPDLRVLRGADAAAGNLAIILIHTENN
jgi:precorrin-2/cobalt-factor-2 C20-methyltransferase